MGRIATLGRSELPTPPVEIADEVELWARERGRTAKLVFVPTLFLNGHIRNGTWVVHIHLRPNDPRMKLWQQGLAPEPPTEEVWLTEPNPKAGQVIPNTYGQRELPFRPLDIVQLGASGVRRLLEKGDTWSGRGQYRSVKEYADTVSQANEAHRQAVRAKAKEENRLEQREKHRWRFRLPFTSVGVDLRKESTDTGV